MADELNIITSDANAVNVTTEDRIITITNDSDATTVTLSAAETTTVQIATIGPKGDTGATGNVNTTSFATTGSNTFYGLQTISSSTDISALDIHVIDDILWTFRTYNDTYSSTSIGLASWIDNDGVSFLGTENDKPLHIYNNANYYAPTLLISSSGVTIGNKLIVNNGITGSLQGTASFATTASYALNAGAGAGFPFSGSAVITGSLLVSGSGLIVSGGITGSLLGTSSYAETASFAPNYLLIGATGSMLSNYVLNSQTASFATTSSFNSFSSSINQFTQSILTWTGSVARTGSNAFNGNQTITGSTLISGSLNVTGSTNLFVGAGTTVLSSNADRLTITGSLIVTGSSIMTGSLNVTYGITGSLLGTASWSNNSLTASYINASNVVGTITSASYALTTGPIYQTVQYYAGANTTVTLSETANYHYVYLQSNLGEGVIVTDCTIIAPTAIEGKLITVTNTTSVLATLSGFGETTTLNNNKTQNFIGIQSNPEDLGISTVIWYGIRY